MALDKDRLAAFFLAAILTIAIIGSLSILHELDPGLKDFLNSLTGSHWVTKGVLTVVLFPLLSAAFYFILGSEGARKRLRADRIMQWTTVLVAVTLLFIAGSFLVYILHFFGMIT